ncbi:helix-turn-helix transcriptional regulator [Planosporangium flavigriseum]|uniref:Transcriptional regulator n=1 Tax=Planosporangium flavigriseum TaxID=373681 RepID=A0A8J3LR35_9ACTN|nr:helix-turn-helix domain-containing protein [Planosporangium flavigriseum]NJC63710.1 helix-turn-helix transcriptional regulator [Planosporangium flavigriseum]GIG72414.1 transcriptional regulator [Planosporangium flavigriseum]
MESKQVEPNPYAKNCGSRQVIDRIGDRWSVLIVLTLADGVKRYSELAQRIEGVSQKMLTQTLRGLERDGLVTRTPHATVPPRVDYALTDLGRSLLGLVSGLEAWATSHLGDVEAARARYDAREGRHGSAA